MSFEDIAQGTEAKTWESVNSRKWGRKFKYEPEDPEYGPEECNDCDQPMRVERRQLGYSLCVKCQSQAEIDKRSRKH